ncbi:protoporphyrinogen/coproporphyrinogen oxidase [Synechococcus sp. W4D4]|uniref:protoporphyrinogen/coproporphyrinogen oxidase n=1 Tax=Synechococcus sp. W4D4 TaxID=3392294 RepID=UPI0039E82CE4
MAQHLGPERSTIIEEKNYLGGHTYSHLVDGAYWDEGPHISFTKNEYVRQMLNTSLGEIPLQYTAESGNYFQTTWIPHPAQYNLDCMPQQLAQQCLQEIVQASSMASSSSERPNYQDWLLACYGQTFTTTFAAAYTEKYWTCPPSNLTVDWLGYRVSKPDVQAVKAGYSKGLRSKNNYIQSVEYPSEGGFHSFTAGMRKNANVIHDRVISIDIKNKEVTTKAGTKLKYKYLVNTIPLDKFITLINDVPDCILREARNLSCTSMLLVNILAETQTPSPYHWIYVYDRQKYSTRITQTHLLSKHNTPDNLGGFQVEVYESKYRQLNRDHSEISDCVVKELQDMGLIKKIHSVHTQYIPYSNIICDHYRRASLSAILTYLENFGLERQADDLDPMTEWTRRENSKSKLTSEIFLGGRYGQWKYYWSDDCILRGKQIAEQINRGDYPN